MEQQKWQASYEAAYGIEGQSWWSLGRKQDESGEVTTACWGISVCA
jgi:hypothetical protein